MPEIATAAEAPKPNAAETPAQPAEPRPVDLVRGPNGRFQRAGAVKLASQGTLADRMAAMEDRQTKAGQKPPAVEGDTGDEPEVQDEEVEVPDGGITVTPKPEPAKPKRETVEVDPEKPDYTKERLAFNDWKRRTREAHEAQLRQAREQFGAEMKQERDKFEAERKDWSPRLERAERVLKLMDAADYEELAKEAGHENWDGFQKHVMGVLTDPNYKRTRELERIVREREERDAKERSDWEARQQEQQKQRERQAQQQQRAEAIRAHKQGLSEAMAKSANKTVAAMADDERFINTVFEIQRRNYDPATDTTVTPEQAVMMALEPGQVTIRESLRSLRDRLNKADLDDPEQAAAVAAVAAAVTPTPAKPKAPKTAVVPAAATVEPAGPGKWKGPKDPAWKAYRDQKMAEADDAEEKERLARQQARARR